jgi:hypothetical protein
MTCHVCGWDGGDRAEELAEQLEAEKDRGDGLFKLVTERWERIQELESKLSTCEKERDAALGLAASWRMQYNALLQTTADNFMAPKPRGPSSMERSGKLDSEEPK